MSRNRKPHPPRGRKPPRPSFHCPDCGTDSHLFITSITAPSPASSDSVAIFFTCTECEQSYCHVAAADNFAGTLNMTTRPHDVLAFSGQYFHCGQAMQKTGSAILRIDGRIAENEFPSARDVCLELRVMECPCGFRLDLPDP